MASQQLLKDDMMNSFDKEKPQVETIAAVLVVDAVVEDGCNWVSNTCVH